MARRAITDRAKAERARARRLMRKYRITPAQYDEMHRRQNGKCALCLRPPATRPLEVDHDHSNGRVRGLLCFHCNKYLLRPRNTPAVLRRAIPYLQSKFDGRSIRPRRAS